MEMAHQQKDRLDSFGLRGYELVKKELNWDELAKKIVSECYLMSTEKQ